ncbi:MAG: general secretion pathway protein B [Bermanella sp.]|jgi:general secretion pathway protein B
MLKLFKVADLQPGMLVSKVISQHGPVKIRTVGMIRSLEMIKGLTSMGVTEVEVDLSQSLGLLDATTADIEVEAEEAVTKLTPTQQLLQNERRSAKVNNEGSPQYHRSLFMPSMDTLPSSWDLYGKNMSLLLLLVVGGVCVGWNIASIPHWLALYKDKDYVVIDYQPVNTPRKPQDVSSDDDNRTAVMNEQSNNASNEDAKVLKSNANNDNVEGRSQITNSPPPEQTNKPAGQEAEPIVLGYLPSGNNSQQILDSITKKQAEGELIEPISSQSDSNVSAALLRKINKAIADLDNNSDVAPVNPLAASYDDLPRVDQLSVAIQTQIPAMVFSAHMYSSNRPERWVRVNGRRLVEGDFIAQDLQLVNIEPQKVILSFKDEVFTMNALSDW